jgi:hypothetical protein
MSRVVIVPDPDNERGAIAVSEQSGKVVARGHLVVELLGDATEYARSSPVRFVETPQD